MGTGGGRGDMLVEDMFPVAVAVVPSYTTVQCLPHVRQRDQSGD